MFLADIEAWRANIFDETEQATSPAPTHRNRRTCHPKRPRQTPYSSGRLSPPMSSSRSRTSSPAKRQRRGEAGELDLDDTPRPYKSTYTPSISAESDDSFRSPTSGRSSRASPSKQLSAARLLSNGYRLERLPSRVSQIVNPDLQSFVKQLMTIVNTSWKDLPSIFPEDLREDLEPHSLPGRMFYKHPADANDEFPSYTFLKEVEDRARVCESKQQLESAWNVCVHSFLFEKVWGSCLSDDLTSINYLTHCPVISNFKSPRIQNATVDYYVTINAHGDDKERIRQLCNSRPEFSINHTSSGALCTEPIAISIETKLTTRVSEEATVQMAAWHLAHWRSLYHDRIEPLRHVTFLVGVIVYGHAWYVVMSTYSSGKSTTWRELYIGGTENICSIVQLVLALRFLKSWSEMEYWPAYQKDILQF